MLVLLLIGWALAAFGEEVVYRGYIQKLFGDLFGKSLWSVILSIWISSLVFGLAHLEQGWIGVVVTIFDAVIFSLLKRKSDDNLWVSIFTHGFYNTIAYLRSLLWDDYGYGENNKKLLLVCLPPDALHMDARRTDGEAPVRINITVLLPRYEISYCLCCLFLVVQ
jgi:membrane protease YdiL (CAAX protease family)